MDLFNFDLLLWGPGITALSFVLAIGVSTVVHGRRLIRARTNITHRILVTGSRGKSGTVRLIHAALAGTGHPTYAKITGTTAVELDLNQREISTARFGTIGVTEIADALTRANKQGAKFAVFECMAVKPDLIALVQNDIMQAEIVVIPTIRLDHLEDEGDDIIEIGMSILRAVGKPKLIVTGVDQPELMSAYQRHCEKLGIKLVFALANERSPKISGHHPANAAIALEVAHHFHIDSGKARAAMEQASHEPENQVIWKLLRMGRDINYCDLGGANDPQSSAESVSSSAVFSEDREIVPLLVHRWDRPLRALSFANAINPSKVKAVMVTGSLYPWTRAVLIRRGFDPDAILRLTRRKAKRPLKMLDKFAELYPGNEKSVTLVSVENVHDPANDVLHRIMHETAMEQHLEPTVVRFNA